MSLTSTKRVVRKRVRRGTFSPNGSGAGSAGGSGFGSALRALGSSRRSQQASQVHSNQNPLSSRIGQVVSFGRTSRIEEDPRSILQELEQGSKVRKGSESASDETRRSGE